MVTTILQHAVLNIIYKNVFIQTDSNCASERLWLAWAISFIASTSLPMYFSASLPLTIDWTSSALKQFNQQNTVSHRSFHHCFYNPMKKSFNTRSLISSTFVAINCKHTRLLLLIASAFNNTKKVTKTRIWWQQICRLHKFFMFVEPIQIKIWTETPYVVINN